MGTMEALPARVGVVGDVHAEDEFLATALQHFADLGLGAVLCTGDVVDGLGSAQRCCDLLRQRDVATVRGNHDRWFGEDTFRGLPDATHSIELDPAARKFLDCLPRVLEFSTSLLLCHGLGTNDMGKLRDDDFGYALESNDDLQSLLRLARHALVVNGHSHHAMVRTLGSLTVINAGTLKRDNDPCAIVIDFAEARVDVIPFHDTQLRPVEARSFTLPRIR